MSQAEACLGWSHYWSSILKGRLVDLKANIILGWKGSAKLSITTFIIMTLNIKGLNVKLSITALHAECHYAECRILFMVMLNDAFYLWLCWMWHFISCYAECRISFIVMLNDIIIIVMLNVAFHLLLCWMTHYIYFYA